MCLHIVLTKEEIMGLVLNHNIPAIKAVNSLNSLYKRIEKIQHQMSTGKKLNVASDNPATISIATKMNVRISSMNVARDNVGDATNLVGIAEGGMKGISDTLIEMRELATQAKSDTMGAEERAAIQSSIDSLTSEIGDYVAQATFNGIDLLDGTADLSMQTGPDVGDTTSVTISQDYSATGLSVDTLDVSSSANASDAITAIDAALATVDAGRTDMGAMQNRFESKANFLATTVENLTAAVSRIEDFDYAEGQAEMVKLQTQFQANMFALGSAIQLPQNIMSILGGV